MSKVPWGTIANVFIASISIVAMLVSLVLSFLFGYRHGVITASGEYGSVISNLIEERMNLFIPTPTPVLQEEYVLNEEPVETSGLLPDADWGGPDLWVAVNEARIANGVNPLSQADELCTITSIRLNELIELGKLDNHEGFSSLAERREDLKWIFDKYNMAEFLVFGAKSPQDAVDLWFDTLGHKKLITGGEYVYGCTYAQNSFGVAIAAY